MSKMIVKEPRFGEVFVNILRLVTACKISENLFYKINKGSINIYNRTWTKLIFTVKAKRCFEQQLDNAVYTGSLRHKSRFIFSLIDMGFS